MKLLHLFEATPEFRKIERNDIKKVLEIEAAFKDAPWKKAESFFKYTTIVMLVEAKVLTYIHELKQSSEAEARDELKHYKQQLDQLLAK